MVCPSFETRGIQEKCNVENSRRCQIAWIPPLQLTALSWIWVLMSTCAYVWIFTYSYIHIYVCTFAYAMKTSLQCLTILTLYIAAIQRILERSLLAHIDTSWELLSICNSCQIVCVCVSKSMSAFVKAVPYTSTLASINILHTLAFLGVKWRR